MIGAPMPALAESNPQVLSAYLRARAADSDGKVGVAANGYAVALMEAPNDAVIAIRAYRVAVSAGDFTLLNRARAVLERANMAPGDSAILALAEAGLAGDGIATQSAIERVKTGALSFLVPSFRAWAAIDNPKMAMAALDAAGTNAIARRYAQESRALMLIAAGKTTEANDLLAVLLLADGNQVDLRITAAQLFAKAGQPDAARSLLVGNDPSVVAVRNNLGAGRAASTALGISYLLTRLASDLNDGEASRLLIVIARAALRLDPGNDRVRLLLASALARDNAPEYALSVLAGILPGSAFYQVAEAERVELLHKSGDAGAALAAAAALADAPGATISDFRRYADLLTEAGRAEAAVGAYQRAIDRDVAAADWVLYLQLGSALDRAGKWPQAKTMLEKAVALAPDEPIALNYLGYGLLEHDGDLSVAAKLLERASMLRPQDLSILDSLAWAYFLQGETMRALPLLETAAKGESANSTINEHLGDVYWKAGRRYEARYAWRAAALLAKDSDADRIVEKIANGLVAR
ncbi:MAG: hypothetical protein K2X59_12445 [Sphingomonas sp.]|nr:hypothetical protein [Sphingomonas sp.]